MIADCAVYRAGERRPGSLRLERAAAASQQADSFAWLALHEPTPYELTTTRAQFGLDALAVADTPKQHKRPAMQIHGEVLFAVLKTARYIGAQEAVRLGQLVLFVGHRFLVSIQSDDAGSGVVAAARKELEARPELLHNSPCTVMYAIVDRIVDDYVAVLAAMDADLHQIEQEVFSPEVRQPGGRIYWHTREVRDFQRATVPLVDMLLHLAAGRFPAVPTSVAPRAEPPRAGLTNSGRPSVATIRSRTAPAPRSWNVSLGRVTDGGVARPAARAIALAAGLSNANRQASGSAPTYGTPSKVRTSWIEPSSPDAPWMAG